MRLLSFARSRALLKKYGIPFAQHTVVKNKQAAVTAAQRFGFPVVLKLLSPDIVHKMDKGVVKTGLRSPTEAGRAYSEIMRKKGKARFEGLLVQKQLTGPEIIIGAKQDPQFGTVVLFGLGGIFTEVLKDVSMRVAPLTRSDAVEMIGEIRGRAVLEGARGARPANKTKIADVILAVSKLAEKERVAELDLNPCFASAQCIAADVRIMVN